jgi:hypothetical protein
VPHTLLHRVSIRPRHLDAWLATWPEQVRLREKHGFTHLQAYVQTHAEPKLTWLYSHDDPAAGEAALAADPAAFALREQLVPHVFGNLVVRPVRIELLENRSDEPGRTVCLRRYSIVGEWTGFLAIWRQIVQVRERYGFRCRFAVADEPKDLFTWAFDFEGTWDDFAAVQRPYYRDPERVALRKVFDYMADYTLDPAVPLRPAGLSG